MKAMSSHDGFSRFVSPENPARIHPSISVQHIPSSKMSTRQASVDSLASSSRPHSSAFDMPPSMSAVTLGKDGKLGKTEEKKKHGGLFGGSLFGKSKKEKEKERDKKK